MKIEKELEENKEDGTHWELIRKLPFLQNYMKQVFQNVNGHTDGTKFHK